MKSKLPISLALACAFYSAAVFAADYQVRLRYNVEDALATTLGRSTYEREQSLGITYVYEVPDNYRGIEARSDSEALELAGQLLTDDSTFAMEVRRECSGARCRSLADRPAFTIRVTTYYDIMSIETLEGREQRLVCGFAISSRGSHPTSPCPTSRAAENSRLANDPEYANHQKQCGTPELRRADRERYEQAVARHGSRQATVRAGEGPICLPD